MQFILNLHSDIEQYDRDATPKTSTSPQSQACVWYDWFLSDSDPDPTVVAHFEDLFLEVSFIIFSNLLGEKPRIQSHSIGVLKDPLGSQTWR